MPDASSGAGGGDGTARSRKQTAPSGRRVERLSPQTPGDLGALLDAAASALGSELEPVQEIPVGASARVVRCRAALGSVFVKSDTPERLTRLALASDLLATVDVPTPEILAFALMGEIPFIVMREADGVDLEAAGVRGIPLERALEHLGELLARMHSIRFDGPGYFDPAGYPTPILMHPALMARWRREPWGLDYLFERGFIDQPTVEAVRQESVRRLAVFDGAPSVLIHGDLRLPHVFMDPGTERVTAIIDFGDLRADHPAWDLTWFWLHAPDHLQHVARGYGEDPDEDVLWLFGLQRLVGEAAWMHQNGFDMGDRLERIRTLLGR